MVLAPPAHADHCKQWLESHGYGHLAVEPTPSLTDGVAIQDPAKKFRFTNTLTARFNKREGALRKAVELRPDLILLELDLSDMSGLKFVDLLKDQPQLKTMPIVAMSIFPYLKAAALYGGCDDFLQKPVKMIDLMNHIRHYLHSSPAPTALTRSVSTF